MHDTRTPSPRRALLVAFSLALVTLAAPGPALAASSPASAPHLKLERFALSLLNCTRTGGWVRTNGTCKDRGSGKHSKYRKPLRVVAGISNRVSRHYSVRLATADACMHTLGGSSIAGRFKAGGYPGYPYGESVGCSGGYSTRTMVIRISRMFQAERRSGGWHWRNLKNRRFNRLGIGIARVGQESRVVYDFYGA
jgi:hypothetical protein